VVTTRQIGIVFVAAAVIIAPIYSDGPAVLWFVSAGLAAYGAYLFASKRIAPPKRKDQHPDDDDENGIEIEAESDGSRRDHHDSNSDETDWDTDSE
jgi:hypothetical protein